MKPSFRSNAYLTLSKLPLACLTGISVAVSSVHVTHAADATWSAAGNGNWVDGFNWSTAAAPGVSDAGVTTTNPDTATFGTSIAAAAAVVADASRNVAGINFAGTNFAYTLSGGPILLTNGGTIQTSGAGTAHTDTITAPVVLHGNAGGHTFTAGASLAGRLLALTTGGVTGVSTTGNTTTLNLNGPAGGVNVISSVIGDGLAGGKVAIVKSGAGVWRLSGANTFTGGVTLQDGALQIENGSGFGNPAVPVQLQGGTLVHNNANFGNALNVTGNVTYVNTQDNPNGSHAGAITGNGTLTFPQSAVVAGTTFNATSSWKWSGDLSGFTGTFIKNTDRNVIFQGGAFDGSNAKWQVNNTAFNGLSVPNLTLNPTITFQMGELSGSTLGVMNGNNGSALLSTYQVGKLSTSTTYNGRINNGGGTGGGPAALTKVGTGTLTLTHGGSTYSGPTNINAGTLAVTIFTVGAVGQGVLGTTTGATLVNNGSTLDVLSAIGLEPLTITGNGVGGNGALVTSTGTGTASGPVTLTTDSSVGGAGSLNLAGAISGLGFGISKFGAGTTTLSGVSGFTGQTNVNGGTLAVSAGGAIASSSGVVINGSGARFLQSGASAGSPAVTLTQGTLEGFGTVGATTVAAGAGNAITANNSNGLLTVTGNLTFSGAATLNLTTNSTSPVVSTDTLTTSSAGIIVNATSPSWNSGTYHLIGYTGFSGSLSHFTKGTVPNLGARQTANLVDTGSTIALEIVGENPVWTGNVSGEWTTAAIPGPKNWKLSGGTPTDFLPNDSVLFDDTAIANTTLSISTAHVSPAGTTFNNSGVALGGKDYTIAAGTFGIATGSIVKSGTGPLTIQNANSYPGGTAVNGGTLNLDHASAIGTGALTIAGDGTVLLDNTSGAAITLATNNTQAWNADFGFTGTNPLNLGTGAVSIGANRIVTVASSELTVGGAISALSGFGLTKAGPGTLVLNGANTYNGGTTITEGILRGNTISIQGAVTNNAAVVFDQPVDGAYPMVMGGTGAVTKLGAGTLTLSGNNTYAGGTTVSAGTLALPSGTGAGSGPISLGANTLVLSHNATTANMITGNGTINVLGVGQVRLAGDWSGYTGPINLSAGIANDAKLNITSVNAILSAATVINVASGATLFTQGVGVNVPSTINVSGVGNGEGFGALRVDDGSTLSGLVNLLGNTSIGGAAGANATGTISGVISGPFGVTKVRGNGAVTFTGANTYTGPTLVTGGILRVNGSTAASSAVTVNAGTSLQGSGTIAGTVTSAGQIAPGAGTIGTLTTGHTVLTGILAAEVGGATSDQLNVAGSLTITGATLNFTTLAPPTAAKYVFAKYSGDLTGTFGTVNNLPAGYTLGYDATAKEIFIQSAFAAFMNTFTSLTDAEKLPGADPDFDGLTNLLEFALAGSDPTVPGGLPGTFSGGTLTFTKRPAAIGSVTYVIEESSTLGLAPDPWEAVVTEDAADLTPDISYTLPTGMPKEFARLKVTLP